MRAVRAGGGHPRPHLKDPSSDDQNALCGLHVYIRASSLV
jgi:hypothetical protein